MKLYKNIFLLFFFSLMLGVGFVSCSDNDKNDDENNGFPTKDGSGVYVLNNGAYKSSTSSFAYYNFNSLKLLDVFKEANGTNMGDTGQDAIKYGSKTYIGMYGSQLIYVLDKDSKIISTIKSNAGDSPLQPRALTSYNGKVYATSYDGYLVSIDTTKLEIDKKISVGPNPEGLVVLNNKIYVANSGGMQAGYNNTVSIVDANLTSKTDIDVALNPCEVKTDKLGNLYVVARGNYGYGDVDVPGVVQQIDLSTNKATTLYSGRAYSIFPIDSKVYILDKKYVGNKPTSTIVYYDANQKKMVNNSFITDGTTIEDISYIAQSSRSGYYYVLAANGKNNGDCFVFTPTGKKSSQFDTGGAYPVKVLFDIK